MAFSHRDHRARRELRRLYLIFGLAVGALTVVALLVPNSAIRLLAVLGLAISGVGYLLAVDRLTREYEQDLRTVRAGGEASGALRAEVFHEVGFERSRSDDWHPSPHRRPPEPAEGTPPGPPPRGPERSDPPSSGP